ncbi:MAG: cyclic nucleotide-binding domain-containing protein [Microthrixaceae bacterium]
MTFWKQSTESIAWLGRVDFFSGFGEEQLQRVADLSSEVTMPAGTVIIDQGDAGVDCFVIVEGEASVYTGGKFVTTLRAGTVVGEMALVDHRPRTATVVTDTECKLLRFHARQFRALLDEMPKASERVMALLAQRLDANR